jgi:hypothetical protein
MKIKATPLAAVATAALFVLTVFPTAARAQQSNWSAWQPCGDSVSVSFAQVAGTSTWTWKFRNDGPQAITFMDFYYTDNTGQNTDVLPGSLNPGGVIGGWAAFTANSVPTILIKSIQRANSTAAGAGGQSSQPQNNGTPSQTPAQPSAGQTVPQPAAPQAALPKPQLAAVNQRLANAQAYQAAGQNLAAAFQGIAASLADADGDAAAAFRADLAPYGKWMDLNGQAYWQPGEAGLASNWRPYADGGHWVLTDAGWTWDSQYDWGWAAFHYGRWADDPVLGWLWAPGRQWGPAWVAWRGNDTLCGWAPLPPGSGYQVGFGFWFHGALVSVDFDFGLGPDDYFFIGISDMCQPGYLACQVPAERVVQAYKQTAIIKTAYMARSGKVMNAGIGADRVRALTHQDIKALRIADAPSSREKGAKGSTLAIYRPKLAAGGLTRPADKPARADQVMDDLLAPASTMRKPALARAARAGEVMDDLLAPAKTRHEAAQKTPNRTGDVMDDLLSGGPAARKTTEQAAPGSEDVMDKLLARGHDLPPPKIGVASRPPRPAGYASGTAASQTGYAAQPAQTYQPPQTYQPAPTGRQPVSGQAYPQNAGRPSYQPAEQVGRPQREWQAPGQQGQAEQERQQQLAQQQQEAQEREQRLAQERQQQMEEQRQQREEQQARQREEAQERQRQLQEQRELERQQQIEAQQERERERQRLLEEQQERERERQRQLEEEREREREKKKK